MILVCGKNSFPLEEFLSSFDNQSIDSCLGIKSKLDLLRGQKVLKVISHELRYVSIRVRKT